MKDNEEKVKAAEEAEKAVKTEENVTNLTVEELSKVSGVRVGRK